MFEAQKQSFEQKLKTALQQGLTLETNCWYLDMEGPVYQSVDNKCCALSPSLLGQKVGRTFTRSLVDIYGVSSAWIVGVIHGFDGNTLKSPDPNFTDGIEWGIEMRKYIKDEPPRNLL